VQTGSFCLFISTNVCNLQFNNIIIKINSGKVEQAAIVDEVLMEEPVVEEDSAASEHQFCTKKQFFAVECWSTLRCLRSFFVFLGVTHCLLVIDASVYYHQYFAQTVQIFFSFFCCILRFFSKSFFLLCSFFLLMHCFSKPRFVVLFLIYYVVYLFIYLLLCSVTHC
jgi:hypothetical protein